MAIHIYCEQCKRQTWFTAEADDFWQCCECKKSKRIYCDCGNIAARNEAGKFYCKRCYDKTMTKK